MNKPSLSRLHESRWPTMDELGALTAGLTAEVIKGAQAGMIPGYRAGEGSSDPLEGDAIVTRSELNRLTDQAEHWNVAYRRLEAEHVRLKAKFEKAQTALARHRARNKDVLDLKALEAQRAVLQRRIVYLSGEAVRIEAKLGSMDADDRAYNAIRSLAARNAVLRQDNSAVQAKLFAAYSRIEELESELRESRQK